MAAKIKLAQWLAPPQAQGLGEAGRGLSDGAGLIGSPSGGEEVFTSLQIQLISLDVDDVARRLVAQCHRALADAQCLAQAGYVHLELMPGRLGRLEAPHVVDQSADGDDLVGVQKQ